MTPVKPTDEQIEALRQQHGEVFTYDFDGGEQQLVLRKPSRPEYMRFQKRIEKEDVLAATEDIARFCVVFPDKKTVEQLLANGFPGLLETAGGDAVKLGRGQQAANAKKALPLSDAPSPAGGMTPTDTAP
jgi:hypothetical protein